MEVEEKLQMRGGKEFTYVKEGAQARKLGPQQV